MRKSPTAQAQRHRSGGYQDAVDRIATHTRRLRESRGWTQEDAASKCADLAPRLYREIENAGSNVTVLTLVRLAEGFDVDVSDLLAPAPAPSPRPRGRPRKPPPDLGPSTLRQEAPGVHAATPLAATQDHPGSDRNGTRTHYSSTLSRRPEDHTTATEPPGDSSDVVSEAARLRQQMDEVRQKLITRRVELSSELQLVESALREVMPASDLAAPTAPRFGPATVIIPKGTRGNLRDFLAALLVANPNGLLTTEMQDAARSAGKRPRKNEIHTIIHALYESGYLTREGRRGAYLYRIK